MVVIKRRSRVISFRVYEDELMRLESACMESGAKSLSDLTRTALMAYVEDGRSPECANHCGVEQKLECMAEKLETLCRIVGVQTPAGVGD